MCFSIREIKKFAFGSLTMSAVTIALMMPAVSTATTSLFEDAATSFKSKCASCHGLDGSGNTAVGKKLNLRDLRSAEVKKTSDAQMNAIITKGKGKMPAAKGLDEAQVKELVAYIRSLK